MLLLCCIMALAAVCAMLTLIWWGELQMAAKRLLFLVHMSARIDVHSSGTLVSCKQCAVQRCSVLRLIHTAKVAVSHMMGFLHLASPWVTLSTIV